jgi:hypothetical protein
MVVVGIKPVSQRGTEQEQPFIDMIRYWVKSWFFDVETEFEYKFSKRLFNCWMKLQKEAGNLSPAVIAVAEKWLQKSVYVQDQYWANHDRLFVGSIECRTTSIVESMHGSMKGGFDGVHQANSAEATAITCVKQAKRKADKISKLNARQVMRQSISDSETYLYLTDYGEDGALEQSRAATDLKVVKRSDRVFHVFKPDDEDSIRKAKETPIPTFYRVRTVEISECGKYAWCSCGYGARNKAACRHIDKVMGGRHPQMYGVRWSVHFQHFFERKGWEKMTAYFRKRELEEWGRDPQKKEQIYVEGLPIPEVTCSEEDIELADRLIFWNQKMGQPRVRGQTVPPTIPVDAESFENFSQDDDGTNDDDIFRVTAELSQGTAGWQERDKTLKAQLALQAKLAATPEYGVAEMTQLFREQLNLARGDRELTEMFIEHHKEGLSKGRQFLAGDLREKSGGATQQTAFSVTGRFPPVNRQEKRKKNTDCGVFYNL